MQVSDLGSSLVRETAFFWQRFLLQNDPFTATGSGQI
jgi:hypothetical protein